MGYYFRLRSQQRALVWLKASLSSKKTKYHSTHLLLHLVKISSPISSISFFVQKSSIYLLEGANFPLSPLPLSTKKAPKIWQTPRPRIYLRVNFISFTTYSWKSQQKQKSYHSQPSRWASLASLLPTTPSERRSSSLISPIPYRVSKRSSFRVKVSKETAQPSLWAISKESSI